MTPRKANKRAAAREDSDAESSSTAAASLSLAHPQSTNVSSPIQYVARERPLRARAPPRKAATSRRQQVPYDCIGADAPNQIIASDNDDVDSIPLSRRPKRKTKQQLGPPITTDERMSTLDETHRLVVENFVQNAKDLGEKVVDADIF
jgi:bloom syndrome protein